MSRLAGNLFHLSVPLCFPLSLFIPVICSSCEAADDSGGRFFRLLWTNLTPSCGWNLVGKCHKSEKVNIRGLSDDLFVYSRVFAHPGQKPGDFLAAQQPKFKKIVNQSEDL